jgi:hypothetical protein
MTTNANSAAASQVIKVMKLLTLAVALSTVMYLIAVVVLVETDGPLMPSLNSQHTTIIIGMMILAFAFLLAGKKILANGLLNAKNSLNGPEARLNAYRKPFVIHLFVLEVPAWVTLTLYLLTGSFPFLALGAVLLGLILSSWPGNKKVSAQLEIESMR